MVVDVVDVVVDVVDVVEPVVTVEVVLPVAEVLLLPRPVTGITMRAKLSTRVGAFGRELLWYRIQRYPENVVPIALEDIGQRTMRAV